MRNSRYPRDTRIPTRYGTPCAHLCGEQAEEPWRPEVAEQGIPGLLITSMLLLRRRRRLVREPRRRVRRPSDVPPWEPTAARSVCRMMCSSSRRITAWRWEVSAELAGGAEKGRVRSERRRTKAAARGHRRIIIPILIRSTRARGRRRPCRSIPIRRPREHRSVSCLTMRTRWGLLMPMPADIDTNPIIIVFMGPCHRTGRRQFLPPPLCPPFR